MQNRIRKAALVLLCLGLAGSMMETVAALQEYPTETDVGIVFDNAYDTKKPDEKEEDKGDKDQKEETNKSGSGSGEETTSGVSESTAQPKTTLPQTGEYGRRESTTGILAGMVLAVMLAVWKKQG